MTLSRADAAHLLRRAGFGATQAEVRSLAGMELVDAVDKVLDTTVNPPVVDPPQLADPDVGDWERWVACTAAWLNRMRTVPAPIEEKLALFWHGHFCSSLDKVGSMRHLWAQNQLFRSRGLGNFEDLCQRVAVQPAMLLYLDNYLNVSGAAQENFARELMELFTLGVNEYTQDDIVAAARAWTGHNLTPKLNAYEFYRSRHDTGDKTFFGRTKNWNGPEVIHAILTGAKQDTAARFIASKLWSFLAHPNPAPALVDALAAEFVSSGLSIRRLVRTIFLRPEFFSVEAKTGLVRSPIEFVVAAMKFAKMPAQQAHPEWWLDRMGQAPFYPPDVSGWKQNGYWISSSAYWARAGFVRHLSWQAAEEGKILDHLSRLSVPNAVSEAFDTFGIDRPSPLTRVAMETWLLAERANHGWAEKQNLLTLTLLSPDFQLA